MPAKGAYRVQAHHEEQHTVLLTSGSKTAATVGPKDASFAACITGLLVFFALCLIIILATLPWRFGSPGSHNHPDKNSGAETDRLKGAGPFTTTQLPSTKSVIIPILTTKRTTTTERIEFATETAEPDAEVLPIHDEYNHDHFEALKDQVNVSTTTERIETAEPDAEDVPGHQNNHGPERPFEALKDQVNSTTTESAVKNFEVETFSTLQPNDPSSATLVDQHQDESETWSEDELCETGACKAFASRMLSMMNHTVDPCDDFYEHACGGLRNSRYLVAADPEAEVQERIKAGMGTINEYSPQYYQHFVKFYESCLTYEENFTYIQRKQKVLNVLNETGTFYDRLSWPASYNITSFTNLIISLFKLHSTPLFDVSLDVSSTGRGSFSLRVTPPLHRTLLLDVAAEAHQPSDLKCRHEAESPQIMPGHKEDLKKSYDQYVKCKKTPTEYLDNVGVAMSELGVFDSLPESNRSVLIHEIKITMDLVLLGIRNTILPSDADFRRAILAKDYTMMTINDMQSMYTMIDWEILFNALLGEKLPGDTIVQLYFSDFFDEVFRELSATDLIVLNNALLGTLAHELYAGLVAARPSCDLPRTCMHAARYLMEDVSSLIYLATFTPSQIDQFKTQARNLFAMSKATLERTLLSAEWLENDDVTRNMLIQKLKDMTLELGLDRSALAPERSMNQIPADGDFFDLFIALNKRYRYRMYSLYTSAPQSSHQLWSQFSDPSQTSGTAVYGLNTILIPLGVFSSPHWFSGAPHYITTATLGTLITHEMAHHFDTVGIKFGSKGEMKGVGSSLIAGGNALLDYIGFENCAQSQFEFKQSYPTNNGGIVEFQVPSLLSMNERISDESASYIAMETYLKWLQDDQIAGNRDGHRTLPFLGMSWEQTFFVAQAQVYCTKETILDSRFSLFEDEHLPPPLRVNSMVKNSKKFPEVFKCVDGQAMNSPNKCAPFPILDKLPLPPPLQDNAH